MTAPSIVFLLNSLKRSGSERRTVHLVNGLVREGLDAGVAYLNPPAPLAADLDVEPLFLDRGKAKLSVGAWRRLRARVGGHGVRHVLAVNLYPALYAWLGTRGLDADFSISLNEPPPAAGEAGWRLAAYAPILRRARCVVFGCRAARDAWVDRCGLDPARCPVIHNGVDATRFDPRIAPAQRVETRARLGIGDADPVLGVVANYRPWKGFPDLLSIVERLRDRWPGVRALLVGDGAGDAGLMGEIHRRSLDQSVILVSARDDVRPFLAAMDVFVLSSRQEVFSNAALEAMAMAKPVVLSRVGGLPEMVEDGVSGVLVEPGAVEDFTRAVSAFLGSETLRARTGAAARERVVTRFPLPGMVEAWRGLLTPPGGSPLPPSGPDLDRP